jgi:hypothetical protein
VTVHRVYRFWCVLPYAIVGECNTGLVSLFFVDSEDFSTFNQGGRDRCNTAFITMTTRVPAFFTTGDMAIPVSMAIIGSGLDGEACVTVVQGWR